MSATTHNHDLVEDLNSATPADGTRTGVFSRLLAALHHSRQQQAARELDRHRHLIADARAYAMRSHKR